MSGTNPENVVTLLWEIENFNELFTDKIESPVFVSNSLDRTRWKLCLYPVGCDNIGVNISLSLTRCGSRKPEANSIVLDCELSIIDEYGYSVLASQHIRKQGFVKDQCWLPYEKFVSRDDVFSEKRDDFIPYNVLRVRCRMWKSFDETTLSELLISHTKIERSHFVWKIDNFSCLKDNEVREIHVKKPFSESRILSYRFHTDKTLDEAIIKIASNKTIDIDICCEIMVLDGTGKKFVRGWQKFTLYDENPFQFPINLKLSKLLINKTLYLPMDVLSLQVDCFYWSSDINVSPITIPNLQVRDSFSLVGKNYSPGKAENVLLAQTSDRQPIFVFHNLERFVQDLHCMYKEGLLSDFTLSAGNRTFPVHKSILSARSPVFKAMFTTPLKEKDAKDLDIPDIDGETLHRMLLFVYSNELEDLDWEDAKKLYFAADKYNIEDLKNITCSILKAKLSVSNVCDILVHADLHEDQDLKSSAMVFFTGHDDEIIGTEDWKKFQKKYIPLTMEILSALYTEMKKRIG